MLDAIRSSHLQLKEGLSIGRATKLPAGDFRHVIFAGMGGSALAAMMIKDYVRDEVNIDIVQDYELPEGLITDNTLFIAFSYSGNTEETISCMQQANNLQNVPIVVITHGGEMKDIAEACGMTYYMLPKSDHPRCSIGYGFGLLLGVLEQTGMIPNQSSTVENTIRFMENRMKSLEEESEAFAKRIEGRVPIFYSHNHCNALARMFKIHMNENAKIQSFYGALPEINHNEMVGYTKLLMKPVIVFLHSSYDTARIQERMEVMRNLLTEETDIQFEDIHIEGNSWLEEANFALVYAYFSSYYLAKHYGIDPKELKLVEMFKKRLHHAV